MSKTGNQSNPTSIEYRQGDATYPMGDNVAIVHICNDIGAWGAGFVIPLGIRYPIAKWRYRRWPRVDPFSFELGSIQTVKVDTHHNVYVVNMIAQEGVSRAKNTPPIRYDALRTCLTQVGLWAKREGVKIQMPRIGCGLAGGTWEEVEPIIQDTIVAQGVDVVVFDL